MAWPAGVWWILLAAAAGAACAPGRPDGGPGRPGDPAPWFEDVAAERGLIFRHESGHRERHLLPEIMGAGAALFDMEGDGDLDAYLVQDGALAGPASTRPGNQLFENRGDGTFRNVSAASGADDRGYGMGVAAGDYDGDGDADLYVTNVGPNVLLRNDGRGRFTDVTASAGVGDPGWGTSAAFLDADGDGDLDLFVANYLNWSPAAELTCHGPSGRPDYCSPLTQNPLADVLYRNDGAGAFADVSAAAGLHAGRGNGLGVVAADLDGSGTVDLYVANDKTPNQLWINEGGRFEDRALPAGVAIDLDGRAKAGMGVDAGDLDDDGDLDLVVVNLRGESDSFFRNEGPFFRDDAVAAGLRVPGRPYTRFGMGLVDFDNDGYLDLYVANGRIDRSVEPATPDPYAEINLLLRGLAGGRFTTVAPPGGTRVPLVATSRAAAFGDIDGDGGVDVLVTNRDAPAVLLRNVVAARGHWIRFHVVDARDRVALGARVTVGVGPRRVRREVKTAYGYLASHDPHVHVGLGDADRVTDVTVRWPDGTQHAFGDFAADQTVTLRMPGGPGAHGTPPGPLRYGRTRTYFWMLRGLGSPP